MKSSAKTKFAAFDIDWTLHRSALGTEFLVELSRAGLIKKNLESNYKEWQAAPDKAAYFVEHFYPLMNEFKGTAREELESIGRKLAEKAEQNLTAELRQLITSYQTEGRFLIAITSSPLLAAGPLTELLRFDICVAPDYLYDEAGHFIDVYHRTADEKDKGKVLAKLVAEHNLSWQDSAAYGDSIDDLPMLECVENPVAVDPTPELARVAEDQGWQVLTTRIPT